MSGAVPAVGDGSQRRTVVFFHAHPDDETLYTGGTMARLAAEGHRVVLVTATAGEAGLAAAAVTARSSLAEVRAAELAAAAGALGCSRVVGLGYRDSGSGDGPPPPGPTFAATPVEEAAMRLAALLDEEGADALTTYDAAGGYGHPDHRQVHLVGVRAAELAGTALVLEATVDRRALQRALRVLAPVTRGRPDFRAERFARLYTPHHLLTHRVDVRAYLAQKRAAMAAHASQATADGTERAMATFLRLPGPLFGMAFGREWYVERGQVPTAPLRGELLEGLGG